MKYVLDTHILVWWFQDSERLSQTQLTFLQQALRERRELLVCEISLWEIATLHSKGRIEFDLPLRVWLEKATAPPLVRLIGITPAIAAEVATLDPAFHHDPADRVLVATARLFGATLITSDSKITQSGLVTVLN